MRTAGDVDPLWRAVEAHVGRTGTEPPFWAWPWPGSIALARVVLDAPEIVHDRRVLDFATGCGLSAIAAALAGAESVTAVELDPLAATACAINAEEAGVALDVRVCDVLESAELPEVDVILAGDVCYNREIAERVVGWLRRCAAAGIVALLADPSRPFAPHVGIDELRVFDVPVPRDLESVATRKTRVVRVLPEPLGGSPTEPT